MFTDKITNKQLYNTFKFIKDMLSKKDFKKLEKVEKLGFKGLLEKNNWGVEHPGLFAYSDLVNHMNCKAGIDYNSWMNLIFCEYFRGSKLTNSSFSTLANLKEIARLYTVKEINRQIASLEQEQKEAISENTFAAFTDAGVNAYEVDENQMNKLYSLVLQGKVSFITFVIAYESGKFQIDKTKITNNDYAFFVRLVDIIIKERRNSVELKKG